MGPQFFREVVLRNHRNIRLRLYGVVHSRDSKALSTTGHSQLLTSLREFRARTWLVEASEKSLELSKFVWNDYVSSTSGSDLSRFCVDESEFVESPALVVAHELGQKDSIIAIDKDSFRTRLTLTKRLILHPLESLILISRYHGRSVPADFDSVDEWRSEFSHRCPTAFQTLFIDREVYMTDRILSHCETSPASSRVAVLLGMSHLNPIYDRIVERS
jgi:hypothetical protein